MTDHALVSTTLGTVRGCIEDGLYVFRGVPYAAPPVGPARWQAAQPHPGWQGVRDATRYGPSAPQPWRPGGIPAIGRHGDPRPPWRIATSTSSSAGRARRLPSRSASILRTTPRRASRSSTGRPAATPALPQPCTTPTQRRLPARSRSMSSSRSSPTTSSAELTATAALPAHRGPRPRNRGMKSSVLAAACDDQHAPPGEAHDDADKDQRVHGQVGTAHQTRHASRDKRESAKRDHADCLSAQAARPCALPTAGVPSCAVPHRHRLRILP